MAHVNNNNTGITFNRSAGRRSQGSSVDRSYSNPYSDDDYLAQISSFENTPYYNYLLNNPWMWSKQGKFSPNLAQQFVGLFGDDSAEQNYINTINSNRAQWLSEALERFRQEDYNTPSAQVSRLAQAGINPDLSGNVDAGSAAENDQPILGNPQFGSDGSLQALGSFFLNVYSLASGFVKDAVSMQSMMNGLTSEDLDINSKMVGAVTDYLKGHIGSPRISKDDSGNEYYDFPDLSLDDLEDYASKMFRSRSARRRFVKEVNSSYGSARSSFVRYGIIRDAESAKRAVASSIGSNEAYGLDYHKPNDLDPMVVVEKNLSKLSRDVVELQNKYTSDYFHSADGAKAGEASNATNQGVIDDNDARSYQRAMDKVLNRFMESMISDLEKSSKAGGVQGLLSKGILGYLSAFRLQMLPSLPSISLSGLIQNKNFNTNNNTYQ